MSLLAEFDAASPRLPLGPTLETMPTVTVELEREYALDPNHPVSFCWFRTADADELNRTLQTDGTVDAFDQIDAANGRLLYRIRRSDSDVIETYRTWLSVGGELLDRRSNRERWEVQMRFPDRDAFTTYHEFLETEGVDIEIHRLAGNCRSNGRKQVTPSQREALAIAFERGFFEVPRETSLAELAQVLGISEQAVSERLRRGQARLVEKYIC